MEPYLKIFFTFLLSIILLACPIEGRKDLRKYWGNMMNGQPMPEALKQFINQRSSQEEAIKDFIKEFEPIPNVSVYHDDSKKLFADEFEPIPNVTGYLDDSKKLFSDEFEPIPNASVYHDDANPNQVKSLKKDASNQIFADEFEPIPNVSAYSD